MIALGGAWLSRKEENTTVGPGIYAKGNIAHSYYTCNSESPNNCSYLSFLLLSIAANHLFFMSWGSNCFHGYFITLFLPCCMFSAGGCFSWLCCQCITALGTSTLVPLHLMGKCFKQLQRGSCIFLGPNGLLVLENGEKEKIYSGSVWIAMPIKSYIHISHSRKNISVSWELYFASAITATMSYQGQSTRFSITFWTTFQGAFWLETLIPNLVLFCSRRHWFVMISVRKILRKSNLLELAPQEHNSMDNLKCL